MLYTIILAFIFSVLLLTRNYKNKYTWIFSIMFLSISISLFSILLYLTKLSLSSTSLKIDTPFIIYLSKIKINFYIICRTFNLGIAMHMLLSWFFSANSKNKAHFILRFIFFLIPIVIFVTINDPTTTYYILKIIHLGKISDVNYAISAAQSFIVNVNYIIMGFYLIYPILSYYIQYRNDNVILYRTSVIANIICISLINTLFASFFIFGPFKNLLFGNMDLLKFNTSFSLWHKSHYIYISLSTIVILVIITFLLIKFKTTDTVDFFKKREIEKNSKLLDINLKMMLHTYRNMLFSLKLNTQAAINSYEDKETCFSLINEIDETLVNNLETIGMFADCFNFLTISAKHINIITCINDAISKSNIPSNISVDNSVRFAEHNVFGDPLHITEAFHNIIVNSVQAIQESGKDSGIIEFSIKSDAEWISILIRDNGIGITKKNQKKIFNTLFSTKNTHTNWGLGLSYVYKVIKAHLGFIFVRSIPNEYTEFQIMLPCIPRKTATR